MEGKKKVIPYDCIFSTSGYHIILGGCFLTSSHCILWSLLQLTDWSEPQEYFSDRWRWIKKHSSWFLIQNCLRFPNLLIFCKRRILFAIAFFLLSFKKIKHLGLFLYEFILGCGLFVGFYLVLGFFGVRIMLDKWVWGMNLLHFLSIQIASGLLWKQKCLNLVSGSASTFLPISSLKMHYSLLLSV